MVQKYPRKVKCRRVGCTHVTDDRQTDRQTDGFVMPLVKRNVVTFGYKWSKKESKRIYTWYLETKRSLGGAASINQNVLSINALNAL